MTKPHKPLLEDLIRELALEVSLVHRRLAEEAGLNGTDLMSLYFMRAATEPVTPKLLSQHLGLTSGATAILLNRLESRQLIARHPHPTDRRGVILTLGPAADQASIFRLRDRFRELNGEVFAQFTPEELATVQRFIGATLENTRVHLRDWPL